MKIYFAGSIRGGRQDAETYLEIIKLLRTRGEVLTEHVSDASITQMGEDSAEEYIYKRDVAWINEADAVVAEITNPSLGVGYELAYAESKKIPVYCLYRSLPDRKISAMILGNSYFTVRRYETLKEVEDLINTWFK